MSSQRSPECTLTGGRADVDVGIEPIVLFGIAKKEAADPGTHPRPSPSPRPPSSGWHASRPCPTRQRGTPPDDPHRGKSHRPAESRPQRLAAKAAARKLWEDMINDRPPPIWPMGAPLVAAESRRSRRRGSANCGRSRSRRLSTSNNTQRPRLWAATLSCSRDSRPSYKKGNLLSSVSRN